MCVSYVMSMAAFLNHLIAMARQPRRDGIHAFIDCCQDILCRHWSIQQHSRPDDFPGSPERYRKLRSIK